MPILVAQIEALEMLLLISLFLYHYKPKGERRKDSAAWSAIRAVEETQLCRISMRNLSMIRLLSCKLSAEVVSSSVIRSLYVSAVVLIWRF